MYIITLLLVLNYPSLGSSQGTKKVQIWGEVRNPGIYFVPPSTDLVEAISFAGGPRPEAELSRVKLVRAIKDEKITYFNVDDYIEGKSENPPILNSGDLIFVPTSLSARIWEVTRFIGLVAGLSYTIFRIYGD